MKANTRKRAAAFLLAAVMMGSAWQMPGGAFYTEAKESVISEDSISENSISENSISENSISENSISEDSISENSISENSISEDSISGNNISDDDISDIENDIDVILVESDAADTEESGAAAPEGTEVSELETADEPEDESVDEANIAVSEEGSIVTASAAGKRNLKSAALGEGWAATLTYSKQAAGNGGICQSKTGVLVYPAGDSSTALTEGVDYTVKYTGNKKAGKATVTFTGIGSYTGTLKKTYQITPNTDLGIVWADTSGSSPVAAYAKSGAMPRFKVVEMSAGQTVGVLENKKDYTVKVTNNKAPGTMTCVITGKGNYKGYQTTANVVVTNGDLSQGTLSVADKKYSARVNAWKSTVTVLDANGKKLAAGKDYDKAVTYSYEGMDQGLPQAGTTVHVTVQGLGNYAGSSITGSYRIYDSSSISISKLVVKIDAQGYTGEAVALSSGSIHVYASSKDAKAGRELGSSCYEILRYTNNTQTGTAKVTLRGKGSYVGSKQYSFKISAQIAAASPGTGTGDSGTGGDAGNGGDTADTPSTGVTYATPDQYKQAGDADDTASFNRALQAVAGSQEGGNGTFYVPAGTYYINAVTGILPKSYTDITLADGAVIKANVTSSDSYSVFKIKDATFVSITGGTIVGDLDGHSGKAGEYGHGIAIYDSNNVTISKVDISKCWGDGIYIGTEHGSAADVAHHESGGYLVTIKNCTVHDNRRNNISLTCGDALTIDGCTLTGAGGTAPGYGLDIENNFTNNTCDTITVKNTTFADNEGGGMGILTKDTGKAETLARNVTVQNCTVNGSFVNQAGKNVQLKNTKIYGELDARMVVTMDADSTVNDGTEAEDTLVASLTPTGDAAAVTGNASKSWDITPNGGASLKKNTAYRFVYKVKGNGFWRVGTNLNDTTYWCIPTGNMGSNASGADLGAGDTTAVGTGATRFVAQETSDTLTFTLTGINNAGDAALTLESIEVYEVKLE